ncbi:MAG: glycosyltransferase [Sphingopyxis solisilvae]|uniref:glycosyltransferase n=1 Tax=Sphingopyxis solisilvae TaxID=1886788 RepID=UPI004036F52A
MTHALHLTTWHPFIDGVSGVFVVEQCAALSAAGVDVGLIFSRIQGLRSMRTGRALRGFPAFTRLDQPVPTLGFKSWNAPGMNAMVPRLNTFMLRNRYAAYVKSKGRPDILHAHVALEAGVAARRIATETGVKYVVTEHSSAILNGKQTEGQRATARSVYHDAHCVIAVSQMLADRILDICPLAKVRVIPNLVRDPVFSLRRALDGRSDRVVIASVGSLTLNKRFDDAILALSRLPEAMKDRIEHRIVGDGPERAKLEALSACARMSTTFYGNLPHIDALQHVADAHLLLHPSSYETFGVVLAEAMALGVPVVATRCGGPETFVTSETGRLVPVGNVEALRDAVQNILSDRNLWTERAEKIAQYAYERFHEARVAAAIAEAYQ